MRNAPHPPRQPRASAPGPHPPRAFTDVTAYHLQLARRLCANPRVPLLLAWLLDWGGPESIRELLEHTWASHLSWDDSEPGVRGEQHFDYMLTCRLADELGAELALLQDEDFPTPTFPDAS